MNPPRLLIWLAILVLFLAYAASVPLVLFEGSLSVEPGRLGEFMILVVGFGVALFAVVAHMQQALKQYAQAFHDLSPEDADSLVSRLLFGSTSGVLLRVQAGQVDLDGPPVVYKVGGPATLSVDHNSVVVTCRLGVLERVLGPGYHSLRPFERIWDVVDIRPQRRTVTVDFFTRDGIPASCQVSIVCRVASRDIADVDATTPRFGYSKQAVLKVATAKFVRKQDGSDRVLDWVADIANGVMVQTVREVLEQYRLDEFLNPQYWLDEDEGPARIAATPQLLTELESEIEDGVRTEGSEMGVVVERIELGMVRPAEVAISRQWLEFWQAKLQKSVDRYTMQASATHEQLAERARVEAQAMFVNRMLEEIQHLRSSGIQVPPELIIASFMDALHAMSDQGPEMQRLLFQQAESLIRVVDAIERDNPTPGEGASDSGTRAPDSGGREPNRRAR